MFAIKKMTASNTQLNDTQKTLVNMFKKPLTKVQLNKLKIILDAFLKIIDDIEEPEVPEVYNHNFVKKIKKSADEAKSGKVTKVNPKNVWKSL